MINLAVSGCHGRMGQSITRLALKDSAFKLTALLEHQDHPKINQPLHGLTVSGDNDVLRGSDCLIEFTSPEATLTNLHTCMAMGINMVVGTTGFEPEHIEQIKKASKDVAIVLSSNMSVGVNILFKLTEIAAKKSGQNYTITLSESHHVHKKDAPSGTAKTLAHISEKASGTKVKDIASIRKGEIIGDHTVIFESAEDVLTLSHHAKNRDIFAKGALVAAKFLAGKDSGLFTMQDVLGFQ